MRRVRELEDVCMGCGLCEVWCTVQHSVSREPVRAYREEHPRPVSRIRVNDSGITSFAIQCRHCDEPHCIQACISGALYRDERNAVVHDPSRCVGCLSCILVCPYGAIRQDREAGNVASKCDLCPGENVPVCVLNCPNQALVLVED